jgi:hypothetical protein
MAIEENRESGEVSMEDRDLLEVLDPRLWPAGAVNREREET